MAALPFGIIFGDEAGDGTIETAVEVSGSELHLTWTERGGPRLTRSAGPNGFGTTLIDGTVKGQLHGAVARKWPRDGLVITLTIPIAQLDGSGSAA